MTQAEKIQNFIQKHLPKHPNNIVSFAAEHFDVSRTTILRHMHHLIKAGVVTSSGTTKQTIYTLASDINKTFIISLNKKFDEFSFFEKDIAPVLRNVLNKNSYDILEYGITEILNNCKDHSKGTKVQLILSLGKDNITCTITDDGIGVLTSLDTVLELHDPREIIFELSKGKLTSDPANHTGEGLFFTSRAVDYFKISTNDYNYQRDNSLHDWTLQKINHPNGTTITLEINPKTDRDLKNIFVYYTDDDYTFSHTEILVSLASKYGVRNLDKFSHIVLDCKNVAAIGQGFVDQIFRVYQNERPDMTIRYINANDDVEFMIKRGQASSL